MYMTTNEQSKSASRAQRTSPQSNRPTRCTPPCSRDALLATSLFSGRSSLVSTRATSETGAAPFVALSLGIGGFSWPYRLARLALNNYSYSTLFKGATPQCGRVPGAYNLFSTSLFSGRHSLVCTRAICETRAAPFVARVGGFSWPCRLALKNHLFLSLFKGAFSCHKHFHEEGGTDAIYGEETFDDDKDSSQALSVHLMKDNDTSDASDTSDTSDTSEHDSDEEDDKLEYLDPVQLADLDVDSTHIGDDGDDDDDLIIVFADNPEEVVDAKPLCNRAGENIPPQPHSLVHTASYSSNKSGFWKNVTDSSDEESDTNESEDDEVSVVFDEDLWQELEQQVQFFEWIGPPPKPTVFRSH